VGYNFVADIAGLSLFI